MPDGPTNGTAARHCAKRPLRGVTERCALRGRRYQASLASNTSMSHDFMRAPAVAARHRMRCNRKAASTMAQVTALTHALPTRYQRAGGGGSSPVPPPPPPKRGCSECHSLWSRFRSYGSVIPANRAPCPRGARPLGFGRGTPQPPTVGLRPPWEGGRGKGGGAWEGRWGGPGGANWGPRRTSPGPYQHCS